MGEAAAVQAIVTIASTAYGIHSSMEAADAQKAAAAESERLGIENAAAVEAETQEQARRTAAAQSSQQASARARAAASGVAEGGSMSTVTGEMAKEHTRQLDWLKTSGATRAEMTRQGAKASGDVGRAQASATRAGGIAGGIQGVGSIHKSGTKAGWWGK